jgi:hypothetical protein
VQRKPIARSVDAQLAQRARVGGNHGAQRAVQAHRHTNKDPTTRQAQRLQLAASVRRRATQGSLVARRAVRAAQVQMQPQALVLQGRTPAAAHQRTPRALVRRQQQENVARERVRQRRKRVTRSHACSVHACACDRVLAGQGARGEERSGKERRCRCASLSWHSACAQWRWPTRRAAKPRACLL